jgi:putative transcriptional regulator
MALRRNTCRRTGGVLAGGDVSAESDGPMTDAEWDAVPRVPRVAIIRKALKQSQEDFAARFHIPIGTLRDWEQGRKEPDAAARAYLRVIAREPETVTKALEPMQPI